LVIKTDASSLRTTKVPEYSNAPHGVVRDAKQRNSAIRSLAVKWYEPVKSEILWDHNLDSRGLNLDEYN